MIDLTQINILNKNNEIINLKNLNKKIIGLYFSAHYCPPCRKFTPILSTFYEDLIDYYNDMEIIFLSSDEDEISFNNYWEQMTFPALPFIKKETKENLKKICKVELIPSLIFIDETGKIISNDGVNIIKESNGNMEFVRNKLNL